MIITDLIKFGRRCLELFEKYIQENDPKPEIKVFIRHFLTNLEISEKKCSSQGSSEIIQKPEWIRVVFDFTEKELKKCPESTDLSKKIVKKYKKNINEIAKGCNKESQVTFWVNNFAQKLILTKLEGKLNDEVIIEYASLFISGLERSPIDFHYKYYLEGIFLDFKTDLKINDNVMIRQITKEDYEHISDPFFDMRFDSNLGFPSVILEIELSANNELESNDFCSRVLNSLRLFKLGSIISKKHEKTRKSLMQLGGVTVGGGGIHFNSYRKYSVHETEKEEFQSFINTFINQLDIQKESKKNRGIIISFERYNSALLETLHIDRKLMTAVMGLESLFTLEKDRGENAFKLGVRVAKLFEALNIEPINIRKNIEQAYGYRNKVVHGTLLSQEMKSKMNLILPTVLNILRISLIVFLLNNRKGKDTIIKMIDSSLICNASDAKFKKLLKNTKDNYKVPLVFDSN